MPRILLTITALVTAIVVAAGCGSDDSASSGAASLAPAGSLLYGEVTLAPDGDQKAAIDSLVRKFPGQGTAGERIRGLMESALSESETGLSFRKDIEPWLGDEAGFFISNFSPGGSGDGALMIATDDEGAAEDAIAKAAKGEARAATYKDHDFHSFSEDGAVGVVDGWVVIGSGGGFKAAVDTSDGGTPIEDDDRYTEALDDAPEDRLGFMYVNTPRLMDKLRRSGGAQSLGPFAGALKEPMIATFNANEQGVRIESALPDSVRSALPILAKGGGLAAELPADSWLAIAQPELGKTVGQFVDTLSKTVGGRDVIEQQLENATGLDLQRDVIAWMGDWSLFVRGTSLAELNGALVIESSDEAASQRFIDALARLARGSAGGGSRVGPLAIDGGGEGVTLSTPEVPEPIHLFQRDGKVVLAYGDAAAADALDPAERLGDSPQYRDAQQALGGDYDLSFYLAFAPIVSLVDSTGAGDDDGWQSAKPYLEPLGALAAGAKEDGETLRSAFGLSVK